MEKIVGLLALVVMVSFVIFLRSMLNDNSEWMYNRGFHDGATVGVNCVLDDNNIDDRNMIIDLGLLSECIRDKKDN